MNERSGHYRNDSEIISNKLRSEMNERSGHYRNDSEITSNKLPQKATRVNHKKRPE
jgi:hypothetical protein